MTFYSKERQYEGSNWNPFVPTRRDIKRTNKLAGKNPILVGALVFLFPVGAIVYLNRIENFFKFLAYFIIISLTIVIMFGVYVVINKDKGYEEISKVAQVYDSMINIVYLLSRIAVTVESFRAVTLARKRQSETNF